jgi:uncharacterized lipoprotein YmbA
VRGELPALPRLEVLRLESSPGDAAALDAVWIVRQMNEGESRTGRTSVQEKTQGNGYEALAAAHSRAIARLSQDVADAIKSLQTAEPKSSSSGDKPSKP